MTTQKMAAGVEFGKGEVFVTHSTFHVAVSSHATAVAMVTCCLGRDRLKRTHMTEHDITVTG